ncbi:hypothetical protein BDF21DRAFT_475736 [Thamnidium elegans]|nr:hypothetical protein BDF21DRAFT_475736 [Thamnidium elegans]
MSETVEYFCLQYECHSFLEPAHHPELEKNYSRLDDAHKWVLSTGKIVENALYTFSKMLIVDHPSNSFIIDIDDQTYLKQNIFSERELEEIKEENTTNTIVPLPNELQLWYNIYIWSFIDRIFDDVPSLEVIRSEAMSVSSANRKNASRVIGSVAPMERKKIGCKCDFLIRDAGSDHEESLEYGAGEVGILYEQK